MSTMQTPPPEAPIPVGPPERRCPRCGSTLAPDQEWCLACGAAAGTEVVEAEGWRVPLYLGGGLVALAIIGVILAIVALSNQKSEVPAGTPTPVASLPPGATATASAIPTTPAIPTITAEPTVDDGTGTGTATATATATVSPAPTETATADPNTASTFPGWTGSDGDYTIIIESATSQSSAEKVAQKAQDGGLTVGVLNSDDYSSLNGGYWVVFTGDYASKSDAEADLDGVRADFHDAYIKQIKT